MVYLILNVRMIELLLEVLINWVEILQICSQGMRDMKLSKPGLVINV